MNHQETLALLHDYDLEELDAGRRAAVQAHLSGCEECMELADVYRSLREAARAAAGSHPGAAEIVTYAMHRGDLEVAVRQAIEGHLERCGRCAGEVDHIRRAEAATREGGNATEAAGGKSPAAERWRPRGWMALAAGLLVAALVYPAYLGIVQLPRVRAERDGALGGADRLAREAAEATARVDRPQGFEGATDLHVLRPATRGEDRRPLVEVAPDQPFTLLALELLVPDDAQPDGSLLIRIADEYGRVAWSHELTVAAARDAVRASGVLTLVLPLEGLNAGTHTLTASLGDSSAPPLVTVSFELAR